MLFSKRILQSISKGLPLPYGGLAGPGLGQEERLPKAQEKYGPTVLQVSKTKSLVPRFLLDIIV
jgi:hypothetical protein